MTEPGGSKRSLVPSILSTCALIVSVVSFGVNWHLTTEANQISEEALELSAGSVPQLDLRPEIATSWVDAVETPRSAVLHIEHVLQNTGTAEVRGCNTYFGETDVDGKPTKLWGAVVEPSGEVWTLQPGTSHRSSIEVRLDRADDQGGDTKTAVRYVTVWFECDNPAIVTRRELFGVDLSSGEQIDGPFGIRALEALSSADRARQLADVYGNGEPEPGPSPFVPRLDDY